ncbi:efflux RND transporter periplasmic adaptor subunit [Immundisolibacter sp.]|uniref:efflux RND transporter periplasmic adaptor subunit n=1 Tax=Immundisolibacter sp. TaxID=1934948 RepID=UPI002B107024|nr:efflux RND transporter periplasmic adaptor subunit [Immundisolibacter sp.]MEA3219367.1 Efflux pump periplasmic linker BepF [Immundisolibacter sp.]
MTHPRPTGLAGRALRAGGLLLALLTLAACGQPSAGASAPAAPPVAIPLVRTVLPEATAPAEPIRLPARTAPVEQALIRARATGFIAERRVDIGDRVQKGEVLAVISAPEIDRQAQRAAALLAQTRASLQLARTSVERSRPLAQRGWLSQQLLDEREAALAKALADRDAAQAELAHLRQLQSFQTVRAPFSGTIAERHIERGDYVSGSSTGDDRPLFRLVRLDELRVQLDVPQAAALHLPAQGTARLRFEEMPGEVFEAHLTRRSGAIDPQLGTLRVELSMANPGLRLPAGLVGEAELLLRRPAALLVPARAVGNQAGRSVVGVIGTDQRYALLPVTVGRNLGAKIEVVTGLERDARVVLSPNVLLKPGMQVRISQSRPD